MEGNLQMKAKGHSFICIITLLLVTCLAVAEGQGGVSYSGGDGTTMAKAVVINGADESTGLDAEYAWLATHFPGYKMQDQLLMNNKGKTYDALKITTNGGKELTVYFDITGFFGKW